MNMDKNQSKETKQNQKKKNKNKKEKGFKIYPILPKHNILYRKARTFFCILLYKNHAAIPCLNEKCKKRIVFDFFFSGKFLKKIIENGGATDWAVLTCPYCSQLIGFRLEVDMIDAKQKKVNWRIRQTPSMSKEQFEKQFSNIM